VPADLTAQLGGRDALEAEVLAWLEGAEPAAARVGEVMTERPVMSWLNLGEVYYIVLRQAGPDAARSVLGSVRETVHLDDVTEDRILAAGEIKARYPMAYADALAIATARAFDAVLLTGDPEILDAGGPWRNEDLR
jgi:predicted nucleic acid-binding protein